VLAAIGWSFEASAAAGEADSSMFRADPSHLGVYASRAPSLSSVQWRFRPGGEFFSSPTVSKGTVYIGNTDGKLYAVRAADGTPIWSFKTGGAVNSTPAVWNGTVIASSRDGNVYGVDAASGAKRWTFETGGERRFTAPGIHGITPKNEMMPDPFDVFLSSPAIAGGIAYIGSGDHYVYALDAATGALRWKFLTGDVVHASPAVAGAAVYVGSWDRYFYALDARSGAFRWRFATGDDRAIHNQVGIVGSAAVSGAMVYFGCRDGTFYALDARSGTLAWKHDERGSWVIGSPAVNDGVVYYTTSDEKRFWALDARSGAEKFKTAYGSFAFSSPSLAGGVAHFGTFDGRLYGVNASSGAIVARFSTDASAKNLPAHLDKSGNVDLNTFYDDTTLDAIFLGLARIYALGSIAGSPAIAGGVLFVGSTDGTLYAIA
jgi:eukaryotic-like serine/threonine-protein kinase